MHESIGNQKLNQAYYQKGVPYLANEHLEKLMATSGIDSDNERENEREDEYLVPRATEEPTEQFNRYNYYNRRSEYPSGRSTESQNDRLRSEIHRYLADSFEKLVEEVVENIRQDLLQRNLLEYSIVSLRGLNVHAADVEEDVTNLKAQIELDQYQGALPCQRVNNNFVPISESQMRRYSMAAQHAPRAETAYLPVEQAIDNFCEELNPFLTHRMAGYANTPLADALVGGSGGGSGMNHLLPVEVHSFTSGARVSYSPAYYVNYIALAAPTTPILSAIAPGRYIFMLTALNNHQLYDKGVFDVPPTHRIHLAI